MSLGVGGGCSRAAGGGVRASSASSCETKGSWFLSSFDLEDFLNHMVANEAMGHRLDGM